jgi:hypothetical protein
MTQAQLKLIHEAAQIADRQTDKLATRAHVEALVEFLCRLADDWEEESESFDLAWDIRAALKGR